MGGAGETRSKFGSAATRLQYAALPYRLGPSAEFLLITSRETRRWIIPKGWPMKSLSPAQCAAQEALEEAGVEGQTSAAPIGSYTYLKKLSDGRTVPVEVEVFSLHIERQLDDWREKDQRQTRWFSPQEAIEAVQEPGLKNLMRSFAALLANAGNA